MQIDSCRTRLEKFGQNFNREPYRYCSGLKQKFETVTTYGDCSDRSALRGSANLREIRETGLLYRADESCREIGIGDLDPRALADKLLEGMRN